VLGDLLQDLRHARRQLRRAPGLTALVTLTLGLGIGASTAIFSLVNAVLLRPLPVRDPAGLISLSQGKTGGPWGEPARLLDVYSHPLYQRLRGEGTFAELAAQQGTTMRSLVRASESDPPAELAVARAASGNFFQVLGVPAALGRTFRDEDDQAGAEAVVVLAHGYWQRRFAGAPMLGARLEINSTRYTVVGILPPGFTGIGAGERIDLWVPLAQHHQLVRGDSLLTSRRLWWLHVIGRLAPGLDVAAARARANLTLQRFLSEGSWRWTELPDPDPTVPRTAADVRLEIASGSRGLEGVRGIYRQPLLVLMAGVGVLLLIVCLNVGHLLLLRGLRRQRELAIRAALGATPARLVRQLLVEGLLLSALGGMAGLLTMRWLIDGVLALAPGGAALEVDADAAVLGFAALTTLTTASLVGLAPAWQAARASLQVRSPVMEGRGRLARLLMISQVVFAVVLLVGAGLLGATLQRLRAVDTGVDRGHLLVAAVLSREAGLTEAQALPLHEALVRRAGALPGVRAASMSSPTGWWEMLLPSGAASTGLQRMTVTPEHFQTVGLTLLEGRGFTRQDHAGAPGVVIVNRTLARQLLGGAAVGKHVRLVAEPGRDLEVVGVVSDALLRGLREPPAPAFYLPVAQWPTTLRRLELRAEGDPALLAGDVRRIVAEVAPGVPLGLVRTMAVDTEESLRSERLLVALSRAFGLAALFLVALGLFGVIGQWAAQRTPEIGVRMALGSTAAGVRWLVLRQALVLVAAGVAVGIPVALVAARGLQGVLYGISPLHPPVIAAAAVALLLVALVAAYLPARRAARVDPMTALRSE